MGIEKRYGKPSKKEFLEGLGMLLIFMVVVSLLGGAFVWGIAHMFYSK